MFDKLLNKKSKPLDCFDVPEKSYNWDPKNLSKMNQKEIRQLCQNQQKFIGLLIKRFEDAKGQYMRLSQKCDEMTQKNQIINQQIARMTNQHEELSIKFTNLSQVLQMCTTEKQSVLKTECNFLQQNGVQLMKNKKDLQNILKVYKNQFQLCKKIEVQNKTLKARLADLEQQVVELQQNNKIKGTIAINSKKSMHTIEQYGTMETQSSNRSVKRAPTKDVGTQTEKIRQKTFCQFLIQTQQTNCDKEKNVTNQDNEQQQLKQYKDNQKTRQDQIQLQLRYKEQINALQITLQNLSAQVTTMRDTISQSQLQKQKNELLCQQSARKVQKLTNEVKRLQFLNKEYEQQLSELKIKIMDIQEKGNSHIQSLEYTKLNSLCPVSCSAEQLPNSQAQSQNQINERVENAIRQSQKRVKVLEQQVKSLKKANKQISQQKDIMQMNNQEHMENLNQNFVRKAQQYQNLKKESLKLNQQIQKLRIEKQNLVTKNKANEQSLSGYHHKFQNNQNEKSSLKQKVNSLESRIQALNQQIHSYNKKIDSLTQDNQCRQRKHQSELNQERIKIQSLKRNLHNVQNKYQQTKMSLEKTYEQNMYKGTKIATLENKLKQYKSLIQLLKKQKVQLEQTFEEKWKSHTNNFGRPEQMTIQQNSYSEETQSPKNHQENQEDQKFNNELLMKQKMIDLEDKNLALMAQLQALQEKLAIISNQNDSHETTIRNLNQKRDMMMKQLQKFSKRNSLPLPNQTQPTLQKKQSKQSNQIKKAREKRIAEKAIKGFQIQRKMQQQLYKDFVKHFADQINSNDNVKQIQKTINLMINKTNDMKDIFQDYL